jgi:hypothetical protein
VTAGSCKVGSPAETNAMNQHQPANAAVNPPNAVGKPAGGTAAENGPSAEGTFVAKLVSILKESDDSFQKRGDAHRDPDHDKSAPFNSKRFFKKWVVGAGCGYFFVFKKNLRVTNIQFAELLSLVRHQLEKQIDGRVQFCTADAFTHMVDELVETFLPFEPGKRRAVDERERRYYLLATLYADLFKSSVIVDTFYGSCGIFVPPGVSLDIQDICTYAGYVWSCGRSIFTRKTHKAMRWELEERIREFFKKYPISPKRVHFAVLSHEDFPEWKGGGQALSGEEIYADGINDVKVHLEKCFMGAERLVSVLDKLKHEFVDELLIAAPSHYPGTGATAPEPDLDLTKRWWLIVDRSIDGDSAQPSGDKYYICYEQLFVNESPYGIFDENKPAWTSHTTIPHSLMAAMINITTPHWPRDRPLRLLDPFAGTGTAFLEAIKFENIIPLCRDASHMTELLVRDNIMFFNFERIQIDELMLQLRAVLKDIPEDGTEVDFKEASKRSKSFQAYERAYGMYRALEAKDAGGVNEHVFSFDFTGSFVADLKVRLPAFFDRLLFYLLLRENLRHASGYIRHTKEHGPMFHKEAAQLLLQMERLMKLKRQVEGASPPEGAPPADPARRVVAYQHSCSVACSANPGFADRLTEGVNLGSYVQIGDARDLKDMGPFDVIVTDPPYGFNTDDDLEGMADLYSKMFRTFLRELADPGQIVFCVPERSYIGRQLSYFTRPEFITQMLFIAAGKEDCDIVKLPVVLRVPKGLFAAPYYWESERALRRSILHFVVKRRILLSDGLSTTLPTGGCRTD